VTDDTGIDVKNDWHGDQDPEAEPQDSEQEPEQEPSIDPGVDCFPIEGVDTEPETVDDWIIVFRDELGECDPNDQDFSARDFLSIQGTECKYMIGRRKINDCDEGRQFNNPEAQSNLENQSFVKILQGSNIHIVALKGISHIQREGKAEYTIVYDDCGDLPAPTMIITSRAKGGATVESTGEVQGTRFVVEIIEAEDEENDDENEEDNPEEGNVGEANVIITGIVGNIKIDLGNESIVIEQGKEVKLKITGDLANPNDIVSVGIADLSQYISVSSSSETADVMEDGHYLTSDEFEAPVEQSIRCSIQSKSFSKLKQGTESNLLLILTIVVPLIMKFARRKLKDTYRSIVYGDESKKLKEVLKKIEEKHNLNGPEVDPDAFQKEPEMV